MSQAAELDPWVPLAYRVHRARRELADISTLELVPLAGEVPSFLPGQFNMLYAFGIGEVAISMSGDPARPGAFVHTVRDVGAVSGAIAGWGPARWSGCADRPAPRGRPRRRRAVTW